MNISRPTKDRLTAAAAALIIVVLAFGIVLIAKSCSYCTVTYYDGTTVLATEKVKKGDKARDWTPEIEGKTFDCWVTEDGTLYVFPSVSTPKIKLYAKWVE